MRFRDIEFKPDHAQAQRFLDIIEKDGPFKFQTLDDTGAGRKELIKELYGKFSQFAALFDKLNRLGAGIYVMTNAGNRQQRRASNVTRVRSVSLDLDGAPLEPVFKAALKPHVIVQTSPGRYQVHWCATGIALDEFQGYQQGLINEFGGDPHVKDLPRLFRLPGYYHNKKDPYLSYMTSERPGLPYSKHDLSSLVKIGTVPVKLAGQENRIPLISNGLIQEGSRNDTFFRMACLLRRNGMELPEIRDCLMSMNQSAAATPLPDHEIVSISESASKYPPHAPPPTPLREDVLPAEPYPIVDLGHVLGPAVKQVVQAYQVPDGLAAQSFLAAAALATQAYENVRIAGNPRPLSCMFTTVGNSGERKSAVDYVALAPIRQFEQKLFDKFELENDQYKLERSVYARASKSKGSAGQPREPEPPLTPMMTCQEPTYEGLVKQLHRGHPSCGIFTDEAGRLLGGIGMNEDNFLKTASGLSEFWDGKGISRCRVSEDPIFLHGRRVSMHLMAQPSVANMLLSSSTLKDQGLLSRMLVSWPKSTIGGRLYRDVDLSVDPHIILYNERMSVSWQNHGPPHWRNHGPGYCSHIYPLAELNFLSPDIFPLGPFCLR